MLLHLSQITGWIAVLLFITEFFGFLYRKTKKPFLKPFKGAHHQAVGKGLVLLALLHGIFGTLALNHLSPSGVILIVGLLLLWLLFLLRKKCGKRWLTVHRWLSFLLLLILLRHIVSLMLLAHGVH